MTTLPRASTRPVALVTGASSGLGYALARELATQGYDLVIAADDDGVHAAARWLASEGGQCRAVRVDLASPLGVESLWSAVNDMRAPIGVAVINAGAGMGGDFTFDPSLPAELRLVALSCGASVHLARLAARHMVARGEGHILVTASASALLPRPFEPAYEATKAFLFAYTERLRGELADKGVTVTAILPGKTEARVFHPEPGDDRRFGIHEPADPDAVARVAMSALASGRRRAAARVRHAGHA